MGETKILIFLSPTNNLSDPEHPPTQKNVEIFKSVAKKSFPFAPSFPNINKNPTNSHPIRNIRIQKNVHFLKFAHEKTCRIN
jgi:hypothetical protein